jgi:ankyrin repeat protein
MAPTALALALLAQGLLACSSAQPKNKNLSLIRAAERGETQTMYALIREGADINAMDAEGWTPYLAASSNGRLEAMRMLRAFGARTEAPESETLARFNQVR